jgi:hypothetical protein
MHTTEPVESNPCLQISLRLILILSSHLKVYYIYLDFLFGYGEHLKKSKEK